jgi:hypothetical protein
MTFSIHVIYNIIDDNARRFFGAPPEIPDCVFVYSWYIMGWESGDTGFMELWFIGNK